MPTIETGHVKNVANFQDLIAFCTANPAYNPATPALTLPSLSLMHTAAKAALTNLTTAQTQLNNAINIRLTAFGGLKKLTTRIINALSACGASAETVKDAKTINRKIQGKRAIQKDTPPATNEGTPPPAGKTISAAQLSHDQLIEHFSRLITLLTATPAYTPNETDISLTGLLAKLNELKAANTAVINAAAACSNSRIARTEQLYHPLTGLVATAGNVKKYIKSAFGAASPQYKQVSPLLFKYR